mmetsp:Transcript_10984/g.36064  ORF Transcript_10984/g.36064 Transcript_10984/m.36064 type:complete len:478 (+) Transcript_10984:82-1515(+)|eukprot:CAMPEP_0170136468 /NCGR_PEP_ID=MMETSP0033_2-20121228/3315_1 /TAXON_ID=195969 /ORGANISM="Dolichomastix tenuilepis, Strain CCMP3274" /LENGTH=477 /DNA_ID=CAMNT_0010372187 /DNA_START=78 /DNA_END=1511 /DNA_ORIENTATION=-
MSKKRREADTESFDEDDVEVEGSGAGDKLDVPTTTATGPGPPEGAGVIAELFHAAAEAFAREAEHVYVRQLEPLAEARAHGKTAEDGCGATTGPAAREPQRGSSAPADEGGSGGRGAKPPPRTETPGEVSGEGLTASADDAKEEDAALNEDLWQVVRPAYTDAELKRQQRKGFQVLHVPPPSSSKLQATKHPFHGITYNVAQKKWVAQMNLRGNNYRMGTFQTAEEAARAWDLQAIKLGRNDLNFPRSEYGEVQVIVDTEAPKKLTGPSGGTIIKNKSAWKDKAEEVLESGATVARLMRTAGGTNAIRGRRPKIRVASTGDDQGTHELPSEAPGNGKGGSGASEPVYGLRRRNGFPILRATDPERMHPKEALPELPTEGTRPHRSLNDLIQFDKVMCLGSLKKGRFHGVYWYEDHKKWVAVIHTRYRLQTLGFFEEEVQAAQRWDMEALEMGMPERNFPVSIARNEELQLMQMMDPP